MSARVSSCHLFGGPKNRGVTFGGSRVWCFHRRRRVVSSLLEPYGKSSSNPNGSEKSPPPPSTKRGFFKRQSSSVHAPKGILVGFFVRGISLKNSRFRSQGNMNSGSPHKNITGTGGYVWVLVRIKCVPPEYSHIFTHRQRLFFCRNCLIKSCWDWLKKI